MGLFCGKGSPDCTVYLQGQGCGKYEADSGKRLVPFDKVIEDSPLAQILQALG